MLAPGSLRRPCRATRQTRDGAYDVNGMRSAFNSYNLDGLDNNAYGTSNQGFSYQVVQASPDAVQEFRFDTNNYSAEYGRAIGGSSLSMPVSRSGYPMHSTGSVWEFLRNTGIERHWLLPAGGRAEANAGAEPVRRALGGLLILKYQTLLHRLRKDSRSSAHTLTYSTLPTAAQKQGDLGTPIANPFTGVGVSKRDRTGQSDHSFRFQGALRGSRSESAQGLPTTTSPRRPRSPRATKATRASITTLKKL